MSRFSVALTNEASSYNTDHRQQVAGILDSWSDAWCEDFNENEVIRHLGQLAENTESTAEFLSQMLSYLEGNVLKPHFLRLFWPQIKASLIEIAQIYGFTAPFTFQNSPKYELRIDLSQLDLQELHQQGPIRIFATDQMQGRRFEEVIGLEFDNLNQLLNFLQVDSSQLDALSRNQLVVSLDRDIFGPAQLQNNLREVRRTVDTYYAVNPASQIHTLVSNEVTLLSTGEFIDPNANPGRLAREDTFVLANNLTFSLVGLLGPAAFRARFGSFFSRLPGSHLPPITSYVTPHRPINSGFRPIYVPQSAALAREREQASVATQQTNSTALDPLADTVGAPIYDTSQTPGSSHTGLNRGGTLNIGLLARAGSSNVFASGGQNSGGGASSSGSTPLAPRAPLNVVVHSQQMAGRQDSVNSSSSGLSRVVSPSVSTSNQQRVVDQNPNLTNRSSNVSDFIEPSIQNPWLSLRLFSEAPLYCPQNPNDNSLIFDEPGFGEDIFYSTPNGLESDQNLPVDLPGTLEDETNQPIGDAVEDGPTLEAITGNGWRRSSQNIQRAREQARIRYGFSLSIHDYLHPHQTIRRRVNESLRQIGAGFSDSYTCELSLTEYFRQLDGFLPEDMPDLSPWLSEYRLIEDIEYNPAARIVTLYDVHGGVHFSPLRSIGESEAEAFFNSRIDYETVNTNRLRKAELLIMLGELDQAYQNNPSQYHELKALCDQIRAQLMQTLRITDLLWEMGNMQREFDIDLRPALEALIEDLHQLWLEILEPVFEIFERFPEQVLLDHYVGIMENFDESVGYPIQEDDLEWHHQVNLALRQTPEMLEPAESLTKFQRQLMFEPEGSNTILVPESQQELDAYLLYLNPTHEQLARFFLRRAVIIDESGQLDLDRL